MYACLYILEIWNVKLYDYPELILIFYRLVTFKTLLNTLPSQAGDTDSVPGGRARSCIQLSST